MKRAGNVQEVGESELNSHQGSVILLRADAVVDQPLISGLIESSDLLLQATDSATIVAAHVDAKQAAVVRTILTGQQVPPTLVGLVKTPAMLKANFWKSLRKRETPYAFRATEQTKSDIEWRMFMGTYKGATDIVTKHVWPRPAFVVTRWLAARGVTPNMVTSVAAVATVLAFFLFLWGHFATGLVAAWLMTFLDTVDGKLARTTLTSSKWGDVFDHGIDLVHPPFWYWAWAMGVGQVGLGFSNQVFWWLMVIILGGYVVQRIMEGIAIKWLGLEIHIWRKIDTYFRQITARRNPNLVLLTVSVVLGRPDIGLIAVAAWTAICLVLHGLQLAQGFSAKTSNGLQSWMNET